MRTISAEQSVAIIPDGASLMIGGFMGVGTPERLIDELVRRKPRDLTVIANDTASPGRGIGKLVEANLLRKAIVSHIGLNPEAQRQMMAGQLEVDLVPQGTLIERIRAGGHGLGGIRRRPASARRSRPASSGSTSTARAICSKPRYAPTLPWCRHSWPITSAT
jgi:acetate CoA/acetoacetate CoA-transferase alpha subunit